MFFKFSDTTIFIYLNIFSNVNSKKRLSGLDYSSILVKINMLEENSQILASFVPNLFPRPLEDAPKITRVIFQRKNKYVPSMPFCLSPNWNKIRIFVKDVLTYFISSCILRHDYFSFPNKITFLIMFLGWENIISYSCKIYFKSDSFSIPSKCL